MCNCTTCCAVWLSNIYHPLSTWGRNLRSPLSNCNRYKLSCAHFCCCWTVSKCVSTRGSKRKPALCYHTQFCSIKWQTTTTKTVYNVIISSISMWNWPFINYLDTKPYNCLNHNHKHHIHKYFTRICEISHIHYIQLASQVRLFIH